MYCYKQKYGKNTWLRKVCYSFLYLCDGLLQIDNRNPSPAELYVLVAERVYAGCDAEILPDELAEGAGPRAVKYAHAWYAQHDGVVNEVADGIDRFVAAKSPKVDVGFEVEFSVVDSLTRGRTYGTDNFA